MLFVGLYYWLAQAWEKVGSKQDALRVWTLCYQKELVDYKFYREGKWYIKNIAHLPLIRRWFKKYLLITWPPEFIVGSKTLHKTPLPEALLPPAY
jgi:hypothetical protein